MKVLWVTNIPLPFISEDLNINTKHNAGWLTGYFNSLRLNCEIELSIAFPMIGQKEILSGKVDGIEYYSFYQPQKAYILPFEEEVRISKITEEHLELILKKANPEIMHIFGTEYQHAMVAAKVFNNPDRTVVSIQGLVSAISKKYLNGIPFYERYHIVFSSIFRGNLKYEASRMLKRGEIEKGILRKINNVIGRTEWDRALTKQINNHATYYHCNEILRESFYHKSWNLMSFEKHTIFMSQANYPIKGLHIMLEALNLIKKQYPKVKLNIAGSDFTNTSTFVRKLKISPYGSFIKRLIKKYNLGENINFLGMLDETEMVAWYLKSNVYVLPSLCENSPNSLGEALLLGVPSISADVGGVKDFITHNSNGFIYPSDEPYMLAYYISRIFENNEISEKISKNGKKIAKKIYDRKNNANQLVDIYHSIQKLHR